MREALVWRWAGRQAALPGDDGDGSPRRQMVLTRRVSGAARPRQGARRAPSAGRLSAAVGWPRQPSALHDDPPARHRRSRTAALVPATEIDQVVALDDGSRSDDPAPTGPPEPPDRPPTTTPPHADPAAARDVPGARSRWGGNATSGSGLRRRRLRPARRHLTLDRSGELPRGRRLDVTIHRPQPAGAERRDRLPGEWRRQLDVPDPARARGVPRDPFDRPVPVVPSGGLRDSTPVGDPGQRSGRILPCARLGDEAVAEAADGDDQAGVVGWSST